MASEEKKSFSIFQYVLVAAAVAAAFWTGTLFQQVREVKKQDQKVAGVETGDSGQGQPKKEVILSEADWKEIVSGGGNTLGQGGAKLTMVEFTDYQCPYCARYSEETFGQIKTKYID